MIQRLGIFVGGSLDPYHNLAVEQLLMEGLPDRCCLLYLWQNQNTVVIGRNQNPWRECRTQLLEQEGGRLARRLSGGGAVYHDLGNLNYTFLVPMGDYDVERQLSVVVEACAGLGLSAVRSGRNDVLLEGKKFSGNAFYQKGARAYHHGTLMVDVDKEKLGRYLAPSKAKLEAKGVASVRSRVVNLSEYLPGLTCGEMKEQMIRAFSRVYRLEPEFLSPSVLDPGALEALEARNGSWEWLFGIRLPFTFSCERRFPWGEIQLQLQVDRGQVVRAKVYSDAMDWSLSPRLEGSLTGLSFTKEALTAGILREFGGDGELGRDLSCMLAEEEI